MALVAVSGVSAHEFDLYTYELRARASLPDSVTVTESPVALARATRVAQTECLADVIYYEARGEGIEGEKAVAEVVLQRVVDGNYPRTVCGVVYEGVQPGRQDCQFTFACDGSLRRPKDALAWSHARRLADEIVDGTVRLRGTTKHAIAYHSVDVAPFWAWTMQQTAQIGNHIFYKRDPEAQTRLAELVGSLPQFAPSDIRLPPLVIKLEVFPRSEKVQPQVQISRAVGDGA